MTARMAWVTISAEPTSSAVCECPRRFSQKQNKKMMQLARLKATMGSTSSQRNSGIKAAWPIKPMSAVKWITTARLAMVVAWLDSGIFGKRKAGRYGNLIAVHDIRLALCSRVGKSEIILIDNINLSR